MNKNEPKSTADNPTAARENKVPEGASQADTETVKDKPTKSTRPARGGTLSGGLALIVATLALIAGGYLWYTLLYQHRGMFDTDVPGALIRLERNVENLQKAFDRTEEQLKTTAETQATYTAALERLQGDLGRNRAEWVLAETEQLLLIANHRLQLARDIKSALSALRTADRQLEQLANPKLLPVRKELAKEIHLLTSLEQTDVAGIALRLGTLAGDVFKLPLTLEVSSLKAPSLDRQKQTTPTGTQAAGSLWQDLLSLVRIRTHTDTQKPLLPPEHQYFLRENLRLMLYGAQNALLQGDVATYQQNLKSASQLVEEYFDTNTQVVTAAQQELDKLLNTKIVIDLPDISASLSALRQLSALRPAS